jgi:prevent-host-death family protein
MKPVNIHEAKTHLSKLIEEACRGESFIIAKAGRPMVRVTAVESETGAQVHRLGFMAGQITVPDEFRPDGQGGDRADVQWWHVKLLLDTHLLVRAAAEAGRQPALPLVAPAHKQRACRYNLELEPARAPQPGWQGCFPLDEPFLPLPFFPGARYVSISRAGAQRNGGNLAPLQTP